jgi:TRAP-type mannitol/chloroaromatic compound transport system permease small subunit
MPASGALLIIQGISVLFKFVQVIRRPDGGAR